MLKGNTINCCEKKDVNLEVGEQSWVVSYMVTPPLVSDYDMILGMNVLSRLRGLVVSRDKKGAVN